MASGEWSDGLTPDVLEHIVCEALADGDIKGVNLAMRVLAGRDPDRADRLLTTMELGLALRRSEAT